MQNLQCLKWSLYYHVDISWNVLLGFPQETNDDYRKQIDLIPSILHLQPPEAVGKFWLERFSPYFMRPHEYGIRITGPGTAYEYVYDVRTVDLKKIAYDFEYEVDSRVDVGLYEELTRLISHWQRRHASDDKPFFYYAKAMSYVTVYDGRAEGRPSRSRFDWPASFIIEYCDETPKSLEQITAGMEETGKMPIPDAKALGSMLDQLVHKRILYAERGKYFTLALPTNQNL
jgi:hypothetical protein